MFYPIIILDKILQKYNSFLIQQNTIMEKVRFTSIPQ